MPKKTAAGDSANRPEIAGHNRPVEAMRDEFLKTINTRVTKIGKSSAAVGGQFFEIANDWSTLCASAPWDEVEAALDECRDALIKQFKSGTAGDGMHADTFRKHVDALAWIAEDSCSMDGGDSLIGILSDKKHVGRRSSPNAFRAWVTADTKERLVAAFEFAEAGGWDAEPFDTAEITAAANKAAADAFYVLDEAAVRRFSLETVSSWLDPYYEEGDAAGKYRDEIIVETADEIQLEMDRDEHNNLWRADGSKLESLRQTAEDICSDVKANDSDKKAAAEACLAFRKEFASRYGVEGGPQNRFHFDIGAGFLSPSGFTIHHPTADDDDPIDSDSNLDDDDPIAGDVDPDPDDDAETTGAVASEVVVLAKIDEHHRIITTMLERIWRRDDRVDVEDKLGRLASYVTALESEMT